tara:strand:+ start:693 stop:803 length:111 start_codon:yes stop_codon:yes gene_type:complete
MLKVISFGTVLVELMAYLLCSLAVPNIGFKRLGFLA